MDAHLYIADSGFSMCPPGSSASSSLRPEPIDTATRGSPTALRRAKGLFSLRDAYDHRTSGSPDGELRAGVQIANARGIPGTLGCLALTLDDRRLVFLTSHHVLFGAGAREQEPIWIAATQWHQSFQRAARSRHGRWGAVNYGGMSVHVDCATAELDEQILPPDVRIVEDAASDTPPLAPGDRVMKTGAGTGTTHGVVVDTNF